MQKISNKLAVLALAMLSIGLAHSAQATGYTLSQVQTHNTSSDCWTIVNNKVYNLTSFISSHPGGSSAIISLCGTNGTTAFTNQHSGNTNANTTLANYYIGDLVLADTTAPNAPTNLNATVISPTQINLAWNAATDNVGISGYTIFRDGNQIATSTATTFYNTGLTASTTYTYLVKAFDAALNMSTSSTAVTATTFASSTTDTTAPTAPTNLVANPISATQINLTWNSATDNISVAGYKVFRNSNQVATTTGLAFNDTGLSATTTYTYFVQAFDFAGNLSTNSNIATATTLAASTSGDTIAPTAPTNLVAKVVSYKHINLAWTASTDNKRVIGYIIFRDGVKIAKVKNTHYNSIRLTPGTSYTYTIQAYDRAGNKSALSSPLAVTTLAKTKPVKYENKNEDHDNDERGKINDRNESDDKNKGKGKSKKD